ncbi:MAG: hypothetical protein DRO14_04725 [Thermoprotei archaeon]|nr:MAG: hypothetical protein DRO14_04725 [Thermoprotei archaeon]
MGYEDAYVSALVASIEFARTGTTLFKDTFSGSNTIENVLDFIKRGYQRSRYKGIHFVRSYRKVQP